METFHKIWQSNSCPCNSILWLVPVWGKMQLFWVFFFFSLTLVVVVVLALIYCLHWCPSVYSVSRELHSFLFSPVQLLWYWKFHRQAFVGLNIWQNEYVIAHIPTPGQFSASPSTGWHLCSGMSFSRCV